MVQSARREELPMAWDPGSLYQVLPCITGFMECLSLHVQPAPWHSTWPRAETQ